MKKNNYKGKAGSELSKTLKEKREALKKFRFSLAGTSVKNVKEGRAVRKDIARILTELNTQKSKSLKV